MADTTHNIRSLTTFRRRSSEFMRQLETSRRPMVLTVKGKAAAVVLDSESYQHLVDVAASADAAEGIRQGIEDAEMGRTRAAKEFFEEFETRNAIPR